MAEDISDCWVCEDDSIQSCSILEDLESFDEGLDAEARYVSDPVPMKWICNVIRRLLREGDMVAAVCAIMGAVWGFWS